MRQNASPLPQAPTVSTEGPTGRLGVGDPILRLGPLVLSLLLLLAPPLVASTDAAAGPAVDAGIGQTGVVALGERGTCDGAIVLIHSDGNYENAYMWEYGGVTPPDYGAFAESYSYPEDVRICSILLDVTQTGGFNGQGVDVAVWQDDGGLPGAIVELIVNWIPDSVPFWPAIERKIASLTRSFICPATEEWWVGLIPMWIEEASGFLVAADVDGGLAGTPRTKIAPGIGYPAGWQDVAVVWGSTQSMGIGVEVVPQVTPTRETTWGRLKTLYQ